MGDNYGYKMVADRKKVCEYDPDMQQSHTTDQPVAP